VNIDVFDASVDRETRAESESHGTAAAQKRAQRQAHLYVIRSEAGMVKIGRSNTPRKRRADLQCASPHKLVLVKILRNRGGEERAVHAILAKWRCEGEWFREDQEFRDAIQTALCVDIRFPSERRDMDAAVAGVVAFLRCEAERKRARHAEIVEERAAKERRRIALKATAADIATYSEAP
jgi:hypothetical protein